MPIIATYKAGVLKNSKYTVDLYHTLEFYIKNIKVKVLFTDLATVSHDAGSNYLANATGKPKEGIPIETWNDNTETVSQKKNTNGKILIK